MHVDRLKRRELITLLGSVAAGWPFVARAQSKSARIGWFTVAPHPYLDAFRRGLRELGWIEGENIVIEQTYADGHPERLPGLATVLARVPYDLIAVSGSDAVEAARAAIQSFPIVGISSTLGMGGSLARSEGNLTGIALLFDEVASKWLELLVEAVPHAQRIGAVFDPSPSDAQQFRVVAVTAERLGKSVLPLRIDNVDAIQPALARALGDRVDGFIFISSPIFTANAARVVELVRATRLPAIFEARVVVAQGGLMSYGPDLNEAFRRAAFYADRILKGTKPADLPIERPTRFELVINLKTAKALSIELPPMLLARADEVIE
jgi:putative ABC transport system substrate-binding protein